MDSWELVLPPSRPSCRHLDWFRHQLRGLGADAPVAVLGATPELRDLLASLSFRHIHVLERNPTFLAKMNRLRTRRAAETTLIGDWLQTLPTCTSNFAAILSDLTSGNVPYSRRSRFYSLVAGALRPGGMFCDKLLSHPIPHENVPELLAKYANAPLNLDTLNRFNCEVFFCSDLLTLFGRVDTTRFHAHLRALNPGPTVTAILDRLPLITPLGMTWDYGLPWWRVQQDFDSSLHCSEDLLEGGDSPYAGRLRCLRWDKVGCPA